MGALASQIVDLVYWLRVFAGLGVAMFFGMLAIFHRVLRVDRWQRAHGKPLERLAAEQRARASYGRALAARRQRTDDTSETPH